MIIDKDENIICEWYKNEREFLIKVKSDTPDYMLYDFIEDIIEKHYFIGWQKILTFSGEDTYKLITDSFVKYEDIIRSSVFIDNKYFVAVLF